MIYGSVSIHLGIPVAPSFRMITTSTCSSDHFRISFQGTKVSLTTLVMLRLLLLQELDVSKNWGTPKSSILIGFSIINHPFWGTPIFGNT